MDNKDSLTNFHITSPCNMQNSLSIHPLANDARLGMPADCVCWRLGWAWHRTGGAGTHHQLRAASASTATMSRVYPPPPPSTAQHCQYYLLLNSFSSDHNTFIFSTKKMNLRAFKHQQRLLLNCCTCIIRQNNTDVDILIHLKWVIFYCGATAVELETNLCEVWSFTITDKAPTRAFSWFKAATTQFQVYCGCG